MKRFLVMLSFFTRIPINIKKQVTYEDYVEGVWYVPLISVIIGIVLHAVSMLGDLYYIGIDIGVLVFVAYLIITGALHVDGLADTMDALGSNRSRERMLEIMRDSHIGTFGVIAIVVYGICFIAFSGANIYNSYFLIVPIVGRNTALLVAVGNSYARPEGMGKSFVDGAKPMIYCIGTAVFLGLAYLCAGRVEVFVAWTVAYIVCQVVMFFLVRSIAKRLGGITGDVIGYTVEVSQLVFMLACAFAPNVAMSILL